MFRSSQRQTKEIPTTVLHRLQDFRVALEGHWVHKPVDHQWSLMGPTTVVHSLEHFQGPLWRAPGGSSQVDLCKIRAAEDIGPLEHLKKRCRAP